MSRRPFQALAVWLGALAIMGAMTKVAMAGEPAGALGFRVESNLVYASPGGKDLLLDLYRPRGSGPFPCVLVVHGGAWRIGGKYQLGHYARGLAQRGFVAAAIEYRLAPRHPFPAQIEDCRSALAWIGENAKRYSIDPQRVGAMGYSAGGHLVALLGVQGEQPSSGSVTSGGALPGESDARKTILPRLKAVAAGGAPCDFRRIPAESRIFSYWLGGPRSQLPELYEAASPAAFVGPGDPPIFFFHGADDILVSAENPRQMAKLLQAAGVEAETYIMDDAGHIVAMYHPEALRRALEFLQEHL